MATDYSRTASRVAVAQIAEDAGFDSMQASALDVLSDLLLRYVGEIGAAAHGYAELSNRAAPAADDLLMAFKDMGVRLEDIVAYTNAQDEVSFAHTMPQYPVQRKPRWAPTFSQRKESWALRFKQTPPPPHTLEQAPPPHIPEWLPALPDKHTYVSTPAFPGHDGDARRQRLAASKAKRQAEKSLVKLSERMGDATGAAAGGSGGSGGAAANPFLAAPTWEAASPAAAADGRPDSSAQPASADAEMADAPQLDSLADAFSAAAEGGGRAGGAADPLGSWADAAAGSGTRPPDTLGGAVSAFALDWVGPTGRLLRSPLPVFREEEDAFAAAEEEGANAAAAARAKALGPAGRKERLKARTARGTTDASVERAKEILAAGVDAPLTLGEDAERGGRDRESL